MALPVRRLIRAPIGVFAAMFVKGSRAGVVSKGLIAPEKCRV